MLAEVYPCINESDLAPSDLKLYCALGFLAVITGSPVVESKGAIDAWTVERHEQVLWGEFGHKIPETTKNGVMLVRLSSAEQ